MHNIAYAGQPLKDGVRNDEVANVESFFIKFDSCLLSRIVFAVKLGIDICHSKIRTIYLTVFRFSIIRLIKIS